MKNNQTISMTLSKQAIEKLKKTYANNTFSSNNPYMDTLLKIEGCSISIYNSNKVVFQGELAQEMATLFGYKESQFFEHIGSDEVGTGDYFGPVCVCAAYVNEEIKDKISHLTLKDSKLLSDTQVMTLAKQLQNVVPFSLLVLNNRQYNMIHETNNMNQIKAKLHNQAIAHLIKKISHKPAIIVDQFTPETSYYKYIKDEKQIVTNLTFETKAEGKYLGVAIGAILARAAFVEAFKQLEQQLKLPLFKGASDTVDNAALVVVQTYGWPILDSVAKMHFKNTKKVQEKLNNLEEK